MTFKKFKKQVLTYFNVEHDDYIKIGGNGHIYSVSYSSLRVDKENKAKFEVVYRKKTKSWSINSVNLYPFINMFESKSLLLAVEYVISALICDLRKKSLRCQNVKSNVNL